MTDQNSANDPPAFRDANAPFVYFDYVPTHGVLGGIVQIELAGRTLLPEGDGVRLEVVAICRLRCSPTAAGFLRDSLNAALKMLEQPQQGPTAASKLN